MKKRKSSFSLFGKKKAKVEDVLIFSKQFATMVKAGLANFTSFRNVKRSARKSGYERGS